MRGLVFLISAVALAPTTARADRRLFTSTYEYSTVPEGDTAIQLWHTESHDGDTEALEQILELEHGLTEHWDAGVYTVLTQVMSETLSVPLRFDQLKIQSRYRFADRGEFPVDVMVMGELAKQFGNNVVTGRASGVVARSIDKLTLSVNANAGTDIADSVLELGWAAGATYELHPKASFGVESFGVARDDELGAFVGPALAVAPSSRFWFAITAGFGVTDDAAPVNGRLIVGVEL